VRRTIYEAPSASCHFHPVLIHKPHSSLTVTDQCPPFCSYNIVISLSSSPYISLLYRKLSFSISLLSHAEKQFKTVRVCEFWINTPAHKMATCLSVLRILPPVALICHSTGQKTEQAGHNKYHFKPPSRKRIY
jgi:hypothetical protein